MGLLQKNLSALRGVGQELRQYTISGGVVLVRTTSDPDCPDLLARARHPVLVTAVLVPKARCKDIRTTDAEFLLGQAERMARGVAAPGDAPGLEIDLPETLTKIIRRRRTMRFAGLVAAIAIVLGGCIVLAQSGKKILHPEADERDISAWASAIETQMRRWGEEVKPPSAASIDGGTQSSAVNQFLKLLSRQEQWGRVDAGHLDGEYLCRLPHPAAQVERNPRESDVREAVTGVLRTVTASRAETKDARTPEEIVSDVARSIDYRNWHTSQVRKTSFAGKEECLPAAQRDYIYRFCPSVAGMEDGGLCKALYGIMTDKWGVRGLCEEDLRRRPWFVAACFFEFVSLGAVPETLVATSQPAEGTVASSESRIMERLRKYLPQDSALPRADQRGDNLERPITDAIRSLAERLDVPTAGRDASTILEDVRIRLKQIGESVLETTSAETPEHLRWYLERLACRKPTTQPATTGSGR